MLSNVIVLYLAFQDQLVFPESLQILEETGYLEEFINSIKSKEQQKILIEMTIDYIDFFYKRTKLNLNNNRVILLMTDIIKYIRNDKRFLLFGDENMGKYVQVKDETSSYSSSSSSSSEEELNESDLDMIENIQLDAEGEDDGFDIDDADAEEDDDDDYIMSMVDD